jgi:hypothetical protein
VRCGAVSCQSVRTTQLRIAFSANVSTEGRGCVASEEPERALLGHDKLLISWLAGWLAGRNSRVGQGRAGLAGQGWTGLGWAGLQISSRSSDVWSWPCSASARPVLSCPNHRPRGALSGCLDMPAQLKQMLRSGHAPRASLSLSEVVKPPHHSQPSVAPLPSQQAVHTYSM